MNKKNTFSKKDGHFSNNEGNRVLKIILVCVTTTSLITLLLYYGITIMSDMSPITFDKIKTKIKSFLIDSKDSTKKLLEELNIDQLEIYDIGGQQYIIK